MAVDVDIPPIGVPLVDARTGLPTRAMVVFMHRLWKRTGGETDLIDNSAVDSDTSADQIGMAMLSQLRGSLRDLERDEDPAVHALVSRLQSLVTELQREMDHTPQAAELAALRRQMAEQEQDFALMHAELARLRRRVDELETEVTL